MVATTIHSGRRRHREEISEWEEAWIPSIEVRSIPTIIATTTTTTEVTTPVEEKKKKK